MSQTPAEGNRLAGATSPYLLQHAANPVAWEPWDDEALERARREDKPIFLSIGYSACHWCHVMEEESFEDPATAGILNAHFVAIKVDREERPDLDDHYMEAVQALTGRGGWPMSVWLTPELRPFFGGTYFPPSPRGGLPGFRTLLETLARVWAERRPDVLADARNLAEALERQALGDPPGDLPGSGPARKALDQLRRSFDARWGGFGQAPKFPQAAVLDFLLAQGGPEGRSMALETLDAMARGGIHDPLGGGFARYSVDRAWLTPHFEKMLYDNAQLAATYLAAFQATGEPRHARVARRTLDYLLRDLRDPSGGFHASEDADSEGEEGRFYVFTPAQVEAVLGPGEGALFCEAFGVTPEGCFEGGRSILHRFDAPAPLLASMASPDSPLERRLEAACERLREARALRVPPGRDDKLLAAWNGMALGALARGARILEEPRYLEAALDCADFLRSAMTRDGVLLRSWRRGRGRQEGFLEDYGAVANGLLDLHEATLDPVWLQEALVLVESMRARFEDKVLGGFHMAAGVPPVAGGGAPMPGRRKPAYDGAVPSGNTLAALALVRLGRRLGREDLLEGARALFRCFARRMEQSPLATPGLLSALDLLQGDPVEITLEGDPEDPRARALLRVARAAFLPRRILALAPGTEAREPSVRICRDRTCHPAIRDPEVLRALLASALAPRTGEPIFLTGKIPLRCLP